MNHVHRLRRSLASPTRRVGMLLACRAAGPAPGSPPGPAIRLNRTLDRSLFGKERSAMAQPGCDAEVREMSPALPADGDAAQARRGRDRDPAPRSAPASQAGGWLAGLDTGCRHTVTAPMVAIRQEDKNLTLTCQATDDVTRAGRWLIGVGIRAPHRSAPAGRETTLAQPASPEASRTSSPGCPYRPTRTQAPQRHEHMPVAGHSHVAQRLGGHNVKRPKQRR